MLRAVFMGSDAFSVPVVQRLIDGGPTLSTPVAVVGVVTQPDRPVGRGRRVAIGPVKSLASERGIPVLQPERLNDERAQIELAGLRPDVLVVASYGQILPRSVLDMPARGALNLHPSLLPRMRGPSPIIVTILEGLQESGVTLMYMTARMDAGPIISQLDVYVPGDATGGWLTGFMAERSADLLMRDLPAWLEGKLEPRAQDEEDATYTKLIKKTDGDIDWRMEAADIERRVRAYNPWPWAYTWFGGRQLRIMRAEVVPGEAERGRVRIAADGGVEVGTARDVLRLLEVQLEGRRPVDGRSFVLGYPGVNGVVLGNGA